MLLSWGAVGLWLTPLTGPKDPLYELIKFDTFATASFTFVGGG